MMVGGSRVLCHLDSLMVTLDLMPDIYNRCYDVRVLICLIDVDGIPFSQ